MFKFKRSITGLAVAGAALAAGLGTGGATAEVAQAAGCQWQFPTSINVEQDNGWRAYSTSGRKPGFKYSMSAFGPVATTG